MGTRLRALFAAPDADVDDDICAVVGVLAGWRWETRPSQVAWVPSRNRPRLLASLGDAHRNRRPAASGRAAR